MPAILLKILGLLLIPLKPVFGFFLGALFDWLKKTATDYFEERRRQAEVREKDERLLKEYLEAIKKPGVSREERRRVAERLLNRDS